MCFSWIYTGYMLLLLVNVGIETHLHILCRITLKFLQHIDWFYENITALYRRDFTVYDT